MLKELIEKRAALLKQFDDLKAKLVTEKRSSYTNEEMVTIDKLRTDIADIKRSIEVEKEFEQERNLKLDDIAKDFNILKPETRSSDIVTVTNNELVKYIRQQPVAEQFRGSMGKFLVPAEYFMRATVTSDASHQSQTTTRPVSIIEKNLILQSLGASLTYETGTGIKANYLGSTPASYGTEDVAIADQSYDAGHYDLLPNYSRASYTMSGLRLHQISPSNIAAILASNQNRILQGLEKRTLEHAIANAATIVTGTSATTFYKAAVDAIAGIEYGNAFVFSKASAARAKQAKMDSGSGRLVFDKGDAVGYAGVETSLFTGNTMIFADWSLASMNIWQMEVEIVKDVLGGKGNYLIVSDCYSDGAFGNPNGAYVVKSTNTLALS